MDMTLWDFMKDRWQITKKDIKAAGIDPNKDWEDVTVRELEWLADYLEITVRELIRY